MSLSLGDVFVSLGVKGAEKTLGAIGSVRKGLKDITSTSIETKAAIVGAMYALEKMFASSGAMGTNLTNFNALTGQSAKQLQQWQYAARQAGVANDELTGSVKAVQNSMTSMLMGEGAPKGLALVANKVGFDEKQARDPFYVMRQLQKFAQQAPPDVGNAALKSFGLSEGVISAMRRNAFTPEMMNKAPVYYDKQIAALDRANIAWSNLGNSIEMAFGKFNAKHGNQLVGDISKVATEVIRLAESFTQLAEKLKIFSVIGKIFSGWSMIFEGATKGVDAIQEAIDKPEKRQELGQNIKDFLKEMPSVFKEAASDTYQNAKGAAGFIADMASPTPALASPAANPSMVTPPMPAGAQGQKQDIKIDQHLHFQHEGKDHKQTGDSVKKANQDAFRQFNQGQAS